MAVKAVSDIGTKLYAVASPSDAPSTGYTNLVGVRSTPAKGEAPESLDATELHDVKNVNIPGRVSIPSLEYTFNYTKGNVAKLDAHQGERTAFLEVLPEGNGFLVVGVMNYWSNGVGLNSVHEGTMNIIAESIEEIEDTATYID